MQNKQILSVTMLFVLAMFALAFASVPLYNLFCKVTGYGGTVKQVSEIGQNIGTKKFNIYFNADISPDLNWDFKAQQRKITVVSGKQYLAFYEAKNNAAEISSGTAIYNVTPAKAAKYFSKIDCFCFIKQSLRPDKKAILPVSFFIDSEIENDPLMFDVKEITLSYNFFKAAD